MYPNLNWSEKFEIGVPVIDEQHRRLFDKYNTFVRALDSSSASQASIAPFLIELMEYANTHFETEEQLLSANGFDELDDHKRKHQDFRNQLEKLSLEFYSGHVSLAGTLAIFVRDWLVKHILHDDVKTKKVFGTSKTEKREHKEAETPSILERFGIASFSLNREGYFVEASSLFQAITGFNESELKGMKLVELFTN